MTPEEQEEFEDLKHRIDYLEKTSREHTILISKLSESVYMLVNKLKKNSYI